MQNGQHAWSAFSSRIYTTIPNAGPPHRNGLDYLQSGSSAGMRRQFFAGFRRYGVEGAIPTSLTLPMFVESNAPGNTSDQFKAAFSGCTDAAAALSGTGDAQIGAAGLMLVRDQAGGTISLCIRSGSNLVGIQLGTGAGNSRRFSQGTDF